MAGPIPPRPVQISSRTTDQLRSRTSPPGTPKGEQAKIQAPGNFPGSVVWLSDCDVQKQTTSITICVRHGSRQGSVGCHQELSSPRQVCRLRASGPDRSPSGPAPAARTMHFLALHATAHTVPSTKGPRLGLQPVLHKKGGSHSATRPSKRDPLQLRDPGYTRETRHCDGGQGSHSASKPSRRGPSTHTAHLLHTAEKPASPTGRSPPPRRMATHHSSLVLFLPSFGRAARA